MSEESQQRVAENVLLGVLTLRGKLSGYEVRKWIAESVARFWEIKENDIRPLLERVVTRGLVQTSPPLPQADSTRAIDWDGQIYTLTPAGHEQFANWLSEPPMSQPARNEFLLKVIFAGRGKKEDVIRHIEQFHQYQLQALRLNRMAELFLKGSFFRKHPDLPYWMLVNKYGKHLYNAMKDWSEAALGALQELEKTR
jgi:DNA-binding PadR family transcriptional regulator